VECSLDIINFITAIGTLAAALIAGGALYFEGKRSRFSLGVSTILELNKDFDGEEMRSKRRTAAGFLKKKDFAEGTKGSEALEDVLDFFETMGLMTHNRALDKEMVWNIFFDYLHHYRWAANEYIEMQRKKDSTIYQELIWLDEQTFAIEKRKSGDKYLDLEYSFSWDAVPGNDNKRLIEFLKGKFGIDWVETAEIKKIDNRSIKVIAKENEKNLSLELNDEKNKVNLKTYNNKSAEFKARSEQGHLNIIYELEKERCEKFLDEEL
jgi:hypothetical protein